MEIALPVLQALGSADAAHLAEVAFKGNRRGFYLCDADAIRDGLHVIVEAERGQDLGRVQSLGGVALSKCSAAGTTATFRIVRAAEPEEIRQWIVLRTDEERVRRQSRELVEKHRLKMKVSDAEWQWDRNKLTIYFTAERRVDFRELVRDLARTFRTRIELKQIGVRDEAALLGGVGRCGRQLCCATWLREIKPVSLQLAKDQNLSLNPSQISGTCGRLMCCLTYEHDAYLQARKRFPREGKVLRTQQGTERVMSIDIWRDTVTLADENRQRRVLPLAELRKEMAAAAGNTSDTPGSGAERSQAERMSAPADDSDTGPTGEDRPIRGQRPSARPLQRKRGGGTQREAPADRVGAGPPVAAGRIEAEIVKSEVSHEGSTSAPRANRRPGRRGAPQNGRDKGE